MVLDQAARILVRLCSCGPLLFIGLLMAIDPASVARLSEMLVRGRHNFGHGLRGFSWQERLCEPEEAKVSKAERIALRLAGLVLTACAVLYLAAVN
jgi:hypothetical protein